MHNDKGEPEPGFDDMTTVKSSIGHQPFPIVRHVQPEPFTVPKHAPSAVESVVNNVHPQTTVPPGATHVGSEDVEMEKGLKESVDSSEERPGPDVAKEGVATVGEEASITQEDTRRSDLHNTKLTSVSDQKSNAVSMSTTLLPATSDATRLTETASVSHSHGPPASILSGISGESSTTGTGSTATPPRPLSRTDAGGMITHSGITDAPSALLSPDLPSATTSTPPKNLHPLSTGGQAASLTSLQSTTIDSGNNSPADAAATVIVESEDAVPVPQWIKKALDEFFDGAIDVVEWPNVLKLWVELDQLLGYPSRPMVCH